MYNMIFVSFLLAALRRPSVSSHTFRPRGKLACHGYIMKHVWILAELRGGARRIKRRLSGSIWQAIAFRLPETSRSLETPHFFFQIMIF